jgi:hypothetical protein
MDTSTKLVYAAGSLIFIETQIIELVIQARKEGYSWSKIGEFLSINKQAAWERYSKYCEK